MSTPAQDQGLATYEGGTLLQPYMPGPGYFEPMHAGVDVGLPAYAPVKLVAPGTYIRDSSSPYQSVFQLPSGGYEEYLHLTNTASFPAGQVIPAGTVIGDIAPGTANGLTVPLYGGGIGGPYTSTTPHVHIAEYQPGYFTQATYGQIAGSVDPTGLLAMPSSGAAAIPGSTAPIPAPTAPDSGTVGSPSGVAPLTPSTPVLGGLVGAAGAVGNAAGTVANLPGQVGSTLAGIPGAVQSGVQSAIQGAGANLLTGIESKIPRDAGTRLAVILVGVVLLLIAGTLLSHGKILTVAAKAAAV